MPGQSIPPWTGTTFGPVLLLPAPRAPAFAVLGQCVRVSTVAALFALTTLLPSAIMMQTIETIKVMTETSTLASGPQRAAPVESGGRAGGNPLLTAGASGEYTPGKPLPPGLR